MLLRSPQPWGRSLCHSPSLGWGCLGVSWGGTGVALTSSSSRTTSVLPQRAASCSAVPALVCRLMSMPACSRSLRADSGVSEAGKGGGGDTSAALPAHGTHRMMSMWPFLAARCRGLVPLGSVASPGLGSSSAAHMLLFRSSWTTWLSKHRRSRAARAAQPPVGAAAPPQPLPPLPQQPGIPHSGGTEGPPTIAPGGCPVSLPVLLQHPRDAAVPPHPLPSCLTGGSRHCKDLPQPGQTRTPGPGASSPNCP